MASITEVSVAVASLGDSIVAVAALVAALKGNQITPEDQAKLDGALAALVADKAALDALLPPPPAPPAPSA